MNLDMTELERVIDALLQGKDPKTSLDPEIVMLIQKLMKDVDSIQMDATFKVQLLERIHEKLEARPSWWSAYWWKAALPVLGVMVLGVIFYSPGPIESPTEESDGEVPLIQANRAAGPPPSGRRAVVEQKKTIRTGMIAPDDSPTLVQSNTSDFSGGNPALRRHSEIGGGGPMMADMVMPEPYFEEPPYIVPESRENYDDFESSPVKRVKEQPVSTFSIDVDTGSYANIRRFIKQGALPPKEAVRIEEMINYFSYDYDVPEDTETPFSLTTEMGPNPWNDKTKLLHVGIKGYEDPDKEDLAANLVFLVDVSGSMNDPQKLPLLKQSLRLLSQSLGASDRISLVTYASGTSVVLDGGEGNDEKALSEALLNLRPGGSTAGEAGINLAYATAEKHFIDGGINRILLATDGDFNVGIRDTGALKDLIENKRENGISLTTLGFGTGNYNDHLMEQLADTGNGNYAYIDTLLEAEKVLVTEGRSTLQTIAKDVKIQLEFNPAVVSEYRLIGYENRALKREDFDNDKIDAGEIGAGHTVTAIYEVALVGEGGERVSDLRYGGEVGSREKAVGGEHEAELGFLKLRYKEPEGDVSKLIEVVLDKGDVVEDLEDTTDNYRFAASVAAFGQQLRKSDYIGDFDYDAIMELAKGAKGEDGYGYRGEMIQLLRLSKAIE